MSRQARSMLEELETGRVLSPASLRASRLSHNTGSCTPSRMTPPNPPLYWIASLNRRRGANIQSTHPVPALRLVAPQGRLLVLHLRPRVEHFRFGWSVPRVSSTVD